MYSFTSSFFLFLLINRCTSQLPLLDQISDDEDDFPMDMPQNGIGVGSGDGEVYEKPLEPVPRVTTTSSTRMTSTATTRSTMGPILTMVPSTVGPIGQEGSTGLSRGAIAGIIVAVMLAVILIILIVVFLVKRSHRTDTHHRPHIDWDRRRQAQPVPQQV